ncbi:MULTISPECIES: hypothetical protein [Hyphomicrobiales]|jgi:hypothetical protein|uniref:hypothetical protein n=1 Tax=Methylobacterium sp. CCH7-A2 TaxID=1768789 RepID=UPI00082AEC9D|nr:MULTISPECIES: hypothetical protein [Hyphomicrobiales]
MDDDNFPDGTSLEFSFSMNYSYIVPLSELDEPDELARMIAEDYVRLDERNGLAILTRKGWGWCRYEHSRNRDGGDTFLGTVPLYMSKADLAERLKWPVEQVEAECADRFAPALNSVGYVDYNHVAEIIGLPDASFAPTCVYPRPASPEPYMNVVGGWLYVPHVRQLFQQHDLEIELTVADLGDRLDGTDEPADVREQLRKHGHCYVSWGVVYGPRGHIAYVELDDDGTPHMPWSIAESILREHAGVETLTFEMLKAAAKDGCDRL